METKEPPLNLWVIHSTIVNNREKYKNQEIYSLNDLPGAYWVGDAEKAPLERGQVLTLVHIDQIR